MKKLLAQKEHPTSKYKVKERKGPSGLGAPQPYKPGRKTRKGSSGEARSGATKTGGGAGHGTPPGGGAGPGNAPGGAGSSSSSGSGGGAGGVSGKKKKKKRKSTSGGEGTAAPFLVNFNVASPGGSGTATGDSMATTAKKMWDEIFGYGGTMTNPDNPHPKRKGESDTPKTRHKKKSNKMPKAPTNPYAKQLTKRMLKSKDLEGAQSADQYIDLHLLAAEQIMHKLYTQADKEINVGDTFWDGEDEDAMAFIVIDKGTPEEIFAKHPGAKESWDTGSSEGTKGHDTIYMIDYPGQDIEPFPVGEPWLQDQRLAEPEDVEASKKVEAEEVTDWEVTVYDQPDTLDRYTIILRDPESGEDYWFGASEDPFHPQGFGQGVGDSTTNGPPGPHLGEEVEVSDLPEKVQQYIEQMKAPEVIAELKVKAARTITVPTDELKEAFGFPTDLDKEFFYEAPDYPETDIVYNLENIGEEPKGADAETQEPEFSTQQIDAMRSAMFMAEESAFRDDAETAVKDAVQRTLDEDFSDYQYEYMEEAGEEGMQSFSGTAKGIISANVDWDTTEIVMDDDFVHIIRDILSGDGTFDASALPLDADDIEIKNHLHWLPRYYAIYGGRAPQPDYADMPNVDQDHLKTLYQEELAEQTAMATQDI